jgi:hypothetical protein
MKVLKLVSATLAALLISTAAFAQVPSQGTPPYNVDLGASATTKFVNTAQGPGTVNFPIQNNMAWSGVMCTFNQTAVSGSPSTVFSIQFLDSASGIWNTLVTSTAITTALNTPSVIMLSPGLESSITLPAPIPAYILALGLKLPRFWRVTETVTGASTSTTGTIGCNMLK